MSRVLFESAPTLIFGLFAGVLVDRVRARGLLIVSDLARVAAFGYLAWVAASEPAVGDNGAVVSAMLVALLYGTFSTIFDGTLYSSIPHLVGVPRLAEANGRLAATQNVAFAVGPAIAGALISTTGSYVLVFSLDAATFLVSAASVLLVGPIEVPRLGNMRIRREILEGLRFVWTEPRLRTSTAAVASANLAIGFIEATFVLVFSRLVGAGEEWQQGLLFGVLGAGAVAGASIAPAAVRRAGLGRVVTIGFLILGTGYSLFSLLPFGVLGGTCLFLAFIGLQLINVPVTTIRQTYAPPALVARVVTATRAIGWATLPVGSLVFTAIADATGSFTVIARLTPLIIVAIGCVLFTTVLWKDTFGVPLEGTAPSEA